MILRQHITFGQGPLGCRGQPARDNSHPAVVSVSQSQPAPMRARPNLLLDHNKPQQLVVAGLYGLSMIHFAALYHTQTFEWAKWIQPNLLLDYRDLSSWLCGGRVGRACQLWAPAPNPHHSSTRQPLAVTEQQPQSQAAAGGTVAGGGPLCRNGMLRGSCCWVLGGQLEAGAGRAA